jgi:hypothetical protein
MILQNYVIGLLLLMCFYGNCVVDYRFNETFEGVVLAYDVQIQDKLAKILPAIHPYFGVSLKAKLLLFAPKPNMLLGSYAMSLLIIHGKLYSTFLFFSSISFCSF